MRIYYIINLQLHDEVDFALVFISLQQLDNVGVFEPVGKPTNKNGTDYTNNFSVTQVFKSLNFSIF